MWPMRRTANVYKVGQVNAYIKNLFAMDYALRSIVVKGEVSNCKYHSSGHIYFTLKDETGTLSAVMFAGQRAGLRFRLEEGQNVLVSGSIMGGRENTSFTQRKSRWTGSAICTRGLKN